MHEDVQHGVVLALVWRRRAIRASSAQYKASEYHGKIGLLLSCFNILSSIAVLFLANNKFFTPGNGIAAPSYLLVNPDFWTALASLLIVLTTVLQYILRPDAKELDAKRAGTDFTQIKRDIEVMLASGSIDIADLERIKMAHSHSSKNHALVPAWLWRRSLLTTNNALEEDKGFEISICKMFGITHEMINAKTSDFG